MQEVASSNLAAPTNSIHPENIADNEDSANPQGKGAEIAAKHSANISSGLEEESERTVKFYTLFGVPNLESAISRAREIAASSVMYVPADGDRVQFEHWEESESVAPGVAVAFEMAEPVGAESGDPYRLLTDGQLDQIIRHNKAVLSAVAGGKESVSVACGGKVIFKVNVSPEELP